VLGNAATRIFDGAGDWAFLLSFIDFGLGAAWLIIKTTTVGFPSYRTSIRWSIQIPSNRADLFILTLTGTAILAALAAIGLTVTAPWLIKLGSKPEYVSFVPLIPWFAWAMVPLAVANVLLNNLMAHSRFRSVPALVAVAAGYWVTLQLFHDSFRTVILVLAVFNLLFLATGAWFTWRPSGQPSQPRGPVGC
jgi:hypothetical protein